MVLKIIIKPLAELDIDNAIHWYEEQQEKLGENFLTALKQTLLVVSKNPLSFRKRYKTVRAVAMQTFPYSLYYILENETIFVIAVIHQKRNPKVWKKRK